MNQFDLVHPPSALVCLILRIFFSILMWVGAFKGFFACHLEMDQWCTFESKTRTYQIQLKSNDSSIYNVCLCVRMYAESGCERNRSGEWVSESAKGLSTRNLPNEMGIEKTTPKQTKCTRLPKEKKWYHKLCCISRIDHSCTIANIFAALHSRYTNRISILSCQYTLNRYVMSVSHDSL